MPEQLITVSKIGGADAWPTGLAGQEVISRLFRFQLDFESTDLNLDPKKVVGTDVTVTLDRRDKDGSEIDPRHIHGYISRLSAGQAVHHTGQGAKKVVYRSYSAEIVPWLWFLTQTARCFIFFPEKEDKTIYEIIEAVFDRAQNDLHIQPQTDLKGISDLKQRKVKHCVQYRETDFNFVSRILEQFGVFYYFKHEQGKHTLVLERKKNYPNCVESTADFPSDAGGFVLTDHITGWGHNYEFVPGKWEHRDYNFEQPFNKLDCKAAKSGGTVKLQSNEKYEVYDYPGEFADKGDGTGEADIRMEEEEVEHDVVHGAGSCKTFLPGHKFKLNSHPSSDGEKGEYLVTSVSHSAVQPAPDTSAGGQPSYSNSFTCMPAAIQYRPPRITPKPIVSGIHTAVVVGPKGEEIYTDKYGRVKVVFHWDREGKEKQNSKGEDCCCWIRAAQNIAGKQWGFMAIPRIGQEVVVDFIAGDPDRPLIVGSVYNADQMPHYNPEQDKTKTYIKTNSSKGGDGFNELMFEDKMDEERVFIHAEKNMDVRVKNDSKSRIIGNRHQIIGWEKDGKKGGDQQEMVWQDKHLNIKRHQVEHIEGNQQLMIGNGDADDGGNLDIIIEKKKTEQIDGGSDLIVNGARREKINGANSLTIAGDHQTKSGGDIQLESGAANEIHLKAGMKVIIEAGMQISLVGPGGFVDIGPAGVTIQGIMVKINSGGSAGSGKPCKPDEPEKPKPAKPAQPAQAHDSKTGMKSAPD